MAGWMDGWIDRERERGDRKSTGLLRKFIRFDMIILYKEIVVIFSVIHNAHPKFSQFSIS